MVRIIEEYSDNADITTLAEYSDIAEDRRQLAAS
jgi:hypothetical protein